jgi:hypothetical protein
MILKFHNGNSIFPVYVLFFCFITSVNIFIAIYLLCSMRCVSYSFNFLFAMEETLCCSAKAMTASIHIPTNPPSVPVSVICNFCNGYCVTVSLIKENI